MLPSPPVSLPRRLADRRRQPYEWGPCPMLLPFALSDQLFTDFSFTGCENAGLLPRNQHIKFVDDSDLEDTDTPNAKTPAADSTDAPPTTTSTTDTPSDNADPPDQGPQNSGNVASDPNVDNNTDVHPSSSQTSDIWLTAIDTRCAVEKLTEQVEIMHAAVCSIQDGIQASIQSNKHKRRRSAVVDDNNGGGDQEGTTSSDQENACCKRLRSQLEHIQATTAASIPSPPRVLPSARSQAAWTVGTLVAGAVLGVTAVGVLL